MGGEEHEDIACLHSVRNLDWTSLARGFVCILHFRLVLGLFLEVRCRLLGKMFLSIFVSLVLCFSANAQTYYYAYNGYTKGTFNWQGYTKQQTDQFIKEAFAEFNRHSKLQIKPWSGKGSYQLVIKFSDKVPYNALAVMDGKTILINTKRPVKPNNCRAIILHETLHYLKYTAPPPNDKWGHSKDNNCAYNINGNCDKLCPAEIAFLQKKYGKK